MIFTGKQIPRPNRFLSRDKEPVRYFLGFATQVNREPSVITFEPWPQDKDNHHVGPDQAALFLDDIDRLRAGLISLFGCDAVASGNRHYRQSS